MLKFITRLVGIILESISLEEKVELMDQFNTVLKAGTSLHESLTFGFLHY